MRDLPAGRLRPLSALPTPVVNAFRLDGERLFRALEDARPDDPTVDRQRSRLRVFADAVQVADRPAELLHGVVGGATPALELAVGVPDRLLLVTAVLRHGAALLSVFAGIR